MPVDYSLGKIYKIVGNGKIYVGSTCERLLCQRLAGHRREYRLYISEKGNNVTSFECISDPDCYIELLEVCPCSCKDELLKCEGKWIRDLECVNRIVVGRTKKEYYEENKEAILEKCKAYREANPESTAERKKAYREANKEVILEKEKAFREANKEKIAEYQKAYRLKKKAEQLNI
jgi:hypothetical protein